MTRHADVTATQAAAAKASEAAADALMAWLRTQPGTGEQIAPATGPAAEVGVEAILSIRLDPPSIATPGPAAGPTRREPYVPLRLAHTDWLHHRLLITGPAADLVAFRTMAAGAGTIPWQLDFDSLEDDLFHLLVAGPSRTLSLAGGRILAGQLRAAVGRRHALAVARVGHSRACPFDLHALVPVPDAILRRGPDDPEALAWLWANWGTTQTLRHVAEDEAAAAALQGRVLPAQAVWVLTFWSADWTPWRALTQIAAGWPTLRFDTRPTYDAL